MIDKGNRREIRLPERTDHLVDLDRCSSSHIYIATDPGAPNRKVLLEKSLILIAVVKDMYRWMKTSNITSGEFYSQVVNYSIREAIEELLIEGYEIHEYDSFIEFIDASKEVVKSKPRVKKVKKKKIINNKE